MKLIERNYYLNKLINVVGTPDIKVITGVRRSGKSKLLEAFRTYIEKQNSNCNIIQINFNLPEYEDLLTYRALYDYVNAHYVAGKDNFLFIDEVQMCKDFEKAVNGFHASEKYDIYITGSNAFLLSSDLATLFGGRVYEVKVYPFSFAEYLKYYPSDDLDKSFDDYVIDGGMSGSYLYPKQEDARKYVKSLARTTIIKDVVTKYKLENEVLLNMIVDFLADTIGNKTSIRNIANCLTSNSYKTNDKTCGLYVNLLCNSFLFYPFTRYDIKGKKYLESDKKYYLADLSFRYALLGTKNTDYGFLYENLIAIELLRRNYEVYVGCLYQKEIDFVAIKDGQKIYIQVSDDISRKETLDRELSPLFSIKDAYPKVLLARTKHPDSQVEGVKIIDIARWLSNVSQF